MAVNTVNAQQVTINVNDSLVPDNVATIDKDTKVGNAVSKEQFKKDFDAKALDLDNKIAVIEEKVKTDFKGTIKPSSPVPTEDGSYKPEISSELDKPTDPNSTADWGEKYPNAGNLRAKTGYDTMFYKKGTVWTKSETKMPSANENVEKSLKYFLELPSQGSLLDYTFKISDINNYNIYGVANQFGKILKSDNTTQSFTASGQYYNVWRNIPTIQGNKRITRLVLKVTPYTNNSSDIIKNTTLLGLKNGVSTPLVVGSSTTNPTSLQVFDVDVSSYESISIGLYVYDSIPATGTQTVEFYTSDIEGDEDSVKKYIDDKIGSTTNSSSFINVLERGVKNDGVTDNTTIINNLVKELASKGGGVLHFPSGTYMVSRIVIPDLKEWYNIIIEGEFPPAHRFGTITVPGVFDPDVTKPNGAVIKSISNTNAVIYCASGSSYGNFNLGMLTVRNITIRTKENPQIHGIDAWSMAQLHIENVFVDTGVYNVNAIEPTYDTAGIVTPKNSNCALTYLRNVSICGFTHGIKVYEHTNADEIQIQSCRNGVTLHAADHASYFGRISLHRNRNHVNIDGSHLFTISQLNMEFAGVGQTTPTNAWQTTVYELNDPSNSGVGNITYANVKGGVGKVSTFRINGASGVIVKKVGSEIRLTGSGIAD